MTLSRVVRILNFSTAHRWRSPVRDVRLGAQYGARTALLVAQTALTLERAQWRRHLLGRVYLETWPLSKLAVGTVLKQNFTNYKL